MIDLVVRGGRIVDGSGGERTVGDVAIEAGRIVEVGPRCGASARREIDADGAIVTPGFVDIHTHYDAQVHWDPLVSPSSEHGVTTVVVGNCGLGLAPVRADDRRVLQRLMGGVEDIPQTTLDAGLDWRWESYPEYLAEVDSTPRVMDVGTLVGHGALRIHAMGKDRAYHDAAQTPEIESMARSLHEALEAGALGFSTSRSRLDRDCDGRTTPSFFAEDRETIALAAVVADRGRGLLELSYRGSAGDEPDRFDEELAWMHALASLTRRPVTFGLAQLDSGPDLWRRAFDEAEDAREEGLELRPQTLGRMQSVLIGLETVHPFAYRPSYRALAALPLAERARRLSDPETRRRVLSEESGPAPDDDPFSGLFSYPMDRIFPIDDPPDYEPGPERSLAALARNEGRDPMELLYDLLLADAGRGLLLYAVVNYHSGDHAVAYDMLAHPCSLIGLGDGGAHCGLLCDATLPTYLLSHWSRDRSRGPRFPLEWMVHKLTAEPAGLFGLGDRGLLRPGMRADLNVIDFAALSLEPPRLAHDLPAGGRRLVQGARGYFATVVAGEITREKGVDTGARPGGLARPLPD
ncbi:MAG: amidohydrolase family protein [Deltaproteobacteria bacterium]|jgi:N-acyl-D-aspartate/D-glutamate deacylase|nr:amidohydrolase family protein [Deltaproteobacteria bacterium]